MKVTDKATGNTLVSENDIVTGEWKKNPQRYIVQTDIPPGTSKQIKPVKKAGDKP